MVNGLIQLSKVSFRRKWHPEWLLQDLDLEVGQGESVAVCGGAGSGKTSLAQLAAGLLPPRAGQITRQGKAAIVTQKFYLYQDLTPAENLEFFSRIHGYQGDRAALLEKTGLTPWVKRLAGKTPLGCQKMLQLAVALTSDFSLLILDEPTVGMDGQQRRRLENILQALSRAKKGILFLTADEALPAGIFGRVLDLRGGKLTPQSGAAKEAAEVGVIS